MESFRKLIKGPLGKALLVLFLAPLILVGIEGYFGGSKKTDVAKTVNGQDISNKELDDLVKAYQQQYLQYVQGDESLLNMTAIRNSAENTLIARALLLQQTQKLGISLSDDQFVKMLSQIPDFQVNGQFSNEVFGNYLRAKGLTKETLIANIRQDHALKMLSNTIANYAVVSKADIENLTNLETEQRDLYLASIKLDEYKKNINVTAADIANYYNKYKENFKRSASVDVDYVVVTPDMVNTKPAEVTAEELQHAYAAYKDTQLKNATKQVHHILITQDKRSEAEALKLANDVEAKLKAGMSFTEAAKTYSEDPTSKTKGGLLEGYQAGTLGSQEFDTAVSNLKDDTLSAPVKTNFGYHIIEVKTNEPKIASFEAMKAQLTTDIQKQKAANFYTDSINNLNEAVISGDTLEAVTQQVKVAQIKHAPATTIWTKDPYLSNVNVKAKLFNDEVKNGDKNASSSIQLANGETIWVKVRAYNPQGVETLEQATPAIKAKLINTKAATLAKAKVAQTLKDFETMPAAQALTHSAIKFEKAGTFTRQNLKRDVANVAFTLNPPKAGMWSVGTSDLSDEVVVVAVANVSHATVTPAQAQQITQLYQQTRNEQEMSDYIDYLKSTAKIK